MYTGIEMTYTGACLTIGHLAVYLFYFLGICGWIKTKQKLHYEVMISPLQTMKCNGPHIHSQGTRWEEWLDLLSIGFVSGKSPVLIL